MSLPEGRILTEFLVAAKVAYSIRNQYIPDVGDLVDFNEGTCYKVCARKWLYSTDDPYQVQKKVQIHLEEYYTY